jgi:hypothetical protein
VLAAPAERGREVRGFLGALSPYASSLRAAKVRGSRDLGPGEARAVRGQQGFCQRRRGGPVSILCVPEFPGRLGDSLDQSLLEHLIFLCRLRRHGSIVSRPMTLMLMEPCVSCRVTTYARLLPQDQVKPQEIEMNEAESVEHLVSRLLAAPKVTSGERSVIAEIADRGGFDAPGFVERCVRRGEPPYLVWRAVRERAQKYNDADLLELAENAIRAQGYDETDPPLDAERLQVVLDLDDPKGWVVAAWRDIYADHGQALEVDMALEALADRHLCWNCGDLGVAERDDLFWCVACLEKENKQ